MPELSFGEVVLRLLLAAALTGLIGAERELREAAAGLRTHMLVGVGAALFTLVSAYAWADFRGTAVDPTRIAAQIVSGIGFLGAGALIRQGVSVRGLTTAAGLWAVAAIGMACGAGFYPAAGVATVIVLVALAPLRWAETRLVRLGGDVGVLEVELPHTRSAAPVFSVLDRRATGRYRVELDENEERRVLRLELELPAGLTPAELLDELGSLDEVTAVRWHG